MLDFDWRDRSVERIVADGVAEDSARHDVTTQALVRPEWRVKAVLKAKEAGVVAGLPLAGRFFHSIDARCRFRPSVKEGGRVRPGQVMARIEGRARSVLSAERPALNAVQHLSGIATYTHEQRSLMGKTSTRLLDTRKTLPGWRKLEKYAVRCGGGTNHRSSLGSAVLIKENHLKISREAGADWLRDIESYRRRYRMPIQVEIQTSRDFKEVLRLRPELVLLDNLSVPVLKKMIRRLRSELPSTKIEISGGVKSEQLRKLARLGADRISMGRLTHSAPAFDCSLEITHVDAR